MMSSGLNWLRMGLGVDGVGEMVCLGGEGWGSLAGCLGKVKVEVSEQEGEVGLEAGREGEEMAEFEVGIVMGGVCDWDNGGGVGLKSSGILV